MLNFLQSVPVVVLLLIATTLEVSGDAAIRLAIYNHTGVARVALFLCGAALLFGYGSFLNFGPIEFARVVGLYIATLFVVWQVISYIVFRAVPTMPIVIGGTLIVVGGSIITFWKPT
jgi:small multidrug resistance family-3 protein